MQALDIRPHSRRGTTLAVASLAVMAAAAFSFGLEHQLRGVAQASPFPAPGQAMAMTRMPDAIPEATPARPVEIASAAPRPRHARAAEAPPSADAVVSPDADTAPAVDAAATVAESSPPAEPATSPPPPT